MRLRVACEHPGCDQWADLAWDDNGWWGAHQGDDDDSIAADEAMGRASIGFDKSFYLPREWTFPGGADGPRCPEHSGS